MGVWSTLGKIGAGVAAPFTGGASLAAIPAIDALGAVTSGAAKGSADQRRADATPQLQAAQLAQQGARDSFSAGMQGAQFQQGERARQQKLAILRSLLSGTQDAQITPGNPAIAARMPTMTGGARPSALANRDILMQILGEQAQPIAAPTYQAPAPFQFDKAGSFEKALGGIGLGSSILGALGPLLNRPKATPPLVPPTAPIGGNVKMPTFGNPLETSPEAWRIAFNGGR